MKIKIIIAFLFTCVLSSLAQDITGVVTRNVNVRWKPTTHSDIIKVFNKGKEVLVLKNKGSWSFIKDPINNKKGWVSSKFIQTNISFITKNANVRNTAGGKVLKQINKGEKVIVLQEKENWVFIKDVSNNKKGWVHKSLLSSYNLTSSSSSSSSSSSNSESKSSSASSSSIAVIEDRMRSMGIYNKWVQFYKDMPAKFTTSNINTFVDKVESYKGVMYRFGGTSSSGVDCSGLVYVGLKSIGFRGDRLNAQECAKLGRFIANKASLKKGDIVCFKTPSSSNLVSHVGIYVGNDKFIHAPSSGKRVQYESIYDKYYWSDKFLFGVRLTRN
jgi:cell wall-associated NlpC family hydrolase